MEEFVAHMNNNNNKKQELFLQNKSTYQLNRVWREQISHNVVQEVKLFKTLLSQTTPRFSSHLCYEIFSIFLSGLFASVFNSFHEQN